MSNLDNETNKNNKSAVTYRTVLIFAACICGIIIVSQFDPIKNVFGWIAGILSPVFVGVILAYIVNPLTVFIENGLNRILGKSSRFSEKARKRTSHGISVALSVVFLLSVIALLLFLIIPEFLDNLSRLLAIAPTLIDNAVDWFRTSQDPDNPFMINFGEYVDTLVKTLTEWLGGEVSSAVASLIESFISVVSFLFDFLVSIVVCVYALLEKNKFIAQSKKLLFAVCSSERANDILDIARFGNDVFEKFISGKLITSTIVGIVTFTFMSIMNMPYALLSACIIAITNVIPFFGPFIGGIPTAFIVITTDFRQGIIYIVFLVILQQLEGNIIEPMIMEDKTGVSKFWITFALLLCGGVFGVAGMIFSVPLFAVLFYTIKIYVERSLAKKQLPIPSSSYFASGAVDLETNQLLPAPSAPPRKKISDAFREWVARVKNKSDLNESKETDVSQISDESESE